MNMPEAGEVSGSAPASGVGPGQPVTLIKGKGGRFSLATRYKYSNINQTLLLSLQIALLNEKIRISINKIIKGDNIRYAKCIG